MPSGQVVAAAPVPPTADHHVLVYVFQGRALVGPDAKPLGDGELARLGEGDAVRLRAEVPTRLLLLGGVPIGEPVVRYGPFVMNQPAELQQAIRDYQSGRMGEITRTAQLG